MIEKILCAYLNDKLAVPVYTEEENRPPREYCLIEKVGSRREDLISYATIAIKSYSGSMIAAAELNERVKEAMYASVERAEISSCELNSDYNYTDTETGRYRYQAVFDICHF